MNQSGHTSSPTLAMSESSTRPTISECLHIGARPQSLCHFKRNSQGPSAEEWEFYRPIIMHLYSTVSLQKVQLSMRKYCHFQASLSMYQKRMKKWNMYKNLKSKQKSEFLTLLATSKISPMSLSERARRSIRRHQRTIATPNVSLTIPKTIQYPTSDQLKGDIMAEEASATTLQRGDEILLELLIRESRWNPNQLAQSQQPVHEPQQHNSNILQLGQQEYFWPDDFMQYSIPAPQFRDQFHVTNLIMHSIQQYYSSDNDILKSNFPKDGFWDEFYQGIYLMKVGSTNRAWPHISQCCELVVSQLRYNPSMFIIGLLTVLSPVNTALCPSLRIHLIDYIAQQAEGSVGRNHPISVVSRELRKQDQEPLRSDVLVAFLSDQCQKTLGDTHDLAVVTKRELCAGYRRDGQFEQSMRVACELVNTMTTANGKDSLQRCVALRQVEHIYMDIGKWTEALKVCLEIVGCVDDNMLPTLDTRQEDYAVHTMEDIAKIFMALDEDEKSITWLMKAAACALSLWGSSVVTLHIIDTLEDLLLKYERIEDAAYWRSYDPNVVSIGGLIATTTSPESSSCLAN
ncbi:hypothetical protein F4680DRAFT_424345 [Xylaria scruposa]|nr:hypothetical protein F4680DRAFT_424345 [Xylaria scruposa]